MRIILHGGFHKTGTTSLQGALGVHGPVLADRVHAQAIAQGHGPIAAAVARGLDQ